MSKRFNIFILTLCIVVLSAISIAHAQHFNQKSDLSIEEIIELSKKNDTENSNHKEISFIEEQKKVKEHNEKMTMTISQYVEREAVNRCAGKIGEELNKCLWELKMEAIEKKSIQDNIPARDATRIETPYISKLTQPYFIDDFSSCSGVNECSPACYYKQIEECTFCGLFEVAFNTASKMTLKSINIFSDSVIKIVIVAFAVWLAITVLNFVATLEVRDFKDFAQNVFKQAFMVMVVVLLLQGGVSSFMNLILNPVFQTGMNIAEATLSPRNASEYNKTSNKDAEKFSCPKTKIYDDALGKGALPKSMGDSIICTMTLIQQRAARVKALGSSALCYSWENKVFIVPHLGYFLTGLGLWIGAMVMIIAVPFIMVDAVIQLAIAGALLPLAIGAFAFKSTQKYTKKVWETFLNSMFAFLFMSLIVLMLSTAFENILVESTESLDSLFEGYGDPTIILKNIPWFSTTFLEVCFVLILIWAIMAEARDFAGNFSGSISNTSIGSQIGTMAGSATKNTTLKVTRPLRNAVERTFIRGVKDFAFGAVAFGRNAVKKYQENKAKRKGLKSGNSYSYTSRSGKKAFVLTENNDGSITLAKNIKKVNRAWIPGKVQADGKRHWGFGTKIGEAEIIKIKNDIFSTTSKIYKDKNGNILGIKDSIVRNSIAGTRAFDYRGKIKDKALNLLMVPSDIEGRDKMAIAAVKDLIQQRMPNMNINKKMYSQQKALYDEKGRCIGYEEINADGSKTIAKLSFGENNRLTTEFITIDARGRGIALSSNGIVNTKVLFKTKDGTRDGKIDEKSVRSNYKISAEYQRYYQQKRFNEIPWNELKGMVGEEKALEIEHYLRGHHETNDANMYEFRTMDQI